MRAAFAQSYDVIHSGSQARAELLAATKAKIPLLQRPQPDSVAGHAADSRVFQAPSLFQLFGPLLFGIVLPISAIPFPDVIPVRGSVLGLFGADPLRVAFIPTLSGLALLVDVSTPLGPGFPYGVHANLKVALFSADQALLGDVVESGNACAAVDAAPDAVFPPPATP